MFITIAHLFAITCTELKDDELNNFSCRNINSEDQALGSKSSFDTSTNIRPENTSPFLPLYATKNYESNTYESITSYKQTNHNKIRHLENISLHTILEIDENTDAEHETNVSAPRNNLVRWHNIRLSSITNMSTKDNEMDRINDIIEDMDENQTSLKTDKNIISTTNKHKQNSKNKCMNFFNLQNMNCLGCKPFFYISIFLVLHVFIYLCFFL